MWSAPIGSPSWITANPQVPKLSMVPPDSDLVAFSECRCFNFLIFQCPMFDWRMFEFPFSFFTNALFGSRIYEFPNSEFRRSKFRVYDVPKIEFASSELRIYNSTIPILKCSSFELSMIRNSNFRISDVQNSKFWITSFESSKFTCSNSDARMWNSLCSMFGILFRIVHVWSFLC